MKAAAGESPNVEGVYRFRLGHAGYLFALLAAGVATFGPGGLLAGALILAFWSYVFTGRTRGKAFLQAFLVVLLCSLPLSCLLLPSLSVYPDAYWRMSCGNNLKQIAMAVHNYHDEFGSFPPAYVADEQGKPQHSWRVLLLPFLDEQALYDKYDFDESWDGPHNSQLATCMPSVYSCPATAQKNSGLDGSAGYLAVVDPTTAWPGRTACRFSDVLDGTSNTLLVMESNQPMIPWLEPRDLGLNEALDQVSSSDPEVSGCHHSEDFFYRHYDGRYVAFADGSVRFISTGTSRKFWLAILGKDDGVELDDDELERAKALHKRLKVGNCAQLALLVGLAVFPLPWVWHSQGHR